MILDNFTPEQIAKGPVPLSDILIDSVYYPASRTDGRPIALCNTVWRRLGVNSFVYCDFDLSEKQFMADTRTMHGYHVVGYRHLDPSEYIPDDWRIEMVPEPGDGRRGGYWDTFLGQRGPQKSACWVVFERNADMNPVHGPKRLSVLYVCGEGLATFQQLYCSRGFAPKMLCFIQCWGFAGNWTDFSACYAPFHRTLLKYRDCIPEWLCFGDCKCIHGAIRLRRLDYANIRFLGYRTQMSLERSFGMEPLVVESREYRRVHIYMKGSRRFLAVSISSHMQFALYDITGCHFDLNRLADWLILTDPRRRSGHESFLNDWVGVIGLDAVNGFIPIIDEKLDWHYLDRSEITSRAIAIVQSVSKVYGEGGVCACTHLIRRAMEWSREVLETSARVRLENGLGDPQRCIALYECNEWFKRLPTFATTVHANIGFGRG